MYKWNPTFNLVMKIKQDYKNTCDNNEKSFSKWLEILNKKEYNDIFECLQMNQCDNFLLIRYGIAEMQRSMWTDGDSIYRECRSIVIDLENEAIVLCPFRKFFNIGEVEENSMENILQEIQNAKIVEITNKLDGSMQSARYYNNEIFMAGSMALDCKNSWRLKEGYEMLTDNYKRMIKDNSMYTFTFEYISLRDAHVVLYDKKQEGLYLIGIRNVMTGYQLSYGEVEYYSLKYDIPMTKIENLTFDQVLKQMKTAEAHEKEGWVINLDGHLIKAKADDYIHLHRLLDRVASINVIIQNIAEDKYDDMMCKIPISYRDRIEKIANIVISYKTLVENTVESYCNKAPKDDKKIFMIWVDNNCPKEVRGYIRCKYLHKEFNVLKRSGGGYKKLNMICNYESYSDLFEDSEG